jgi:tetratricopeptide (TPR) repeat protein
LTVKHRWLSDYTVRYEDGVMNNDSPTVNSELLQNATEFIRIGRKADARRLVRQVLERQPNNVSAWYLASFVTGEQGQKIEALQKALEYDPSYRKAIRRLARLQKNLRDDVAAPPSVGARTTDNQLLLPNQPSSNEILILRFGLVCSALLCWGAATLLWTSGNMTTQPLSVGLAIANYAVSFILILLAALARMPRGTVFLVLVAVLVVAISQLQVHTVLQTQFADPMTTDSFMFSDYGARLLRLGYNPYAFDLADSFRVYRTALTLTTPLLDGTFTGRSPYPALAFLLIVPFQWLGISTQLIYPLFFFLSMVVLFFGVPLSWRPVILLPFVAVQEYLTYSLGGVSDIVWVFLLLAMMLAWRNKTQRAIWFGLACAFKQQPWVLAPYLLIRIWHASGGNTRQRWLAVTQFTVIAATTFLVINLPFMLWDFSAWFKGTTEPLQAPMITLGQGLSSLTLFGMVMIPKSAYTLFVVTVFILSLVLYHWSYDYLPDVLWILPAIVLWFGNRSLTSYWFFNAIPLLFSIARNDKLLHPTLTIRSMPHRRLAALALAGAATLIALLVASFRLKQPDITIRIEGPMKTSGDLVYQLSAVVTNNSDQTFTPRLSVQNWNNQPLFWHIDSGPLELKPHTEGRFTLSTDVPLRAFDYKRGAELIASDANHYDLRGATILEGDAASSYVGALPNGTFEYWDLNRNVPYRWATFTQPRDRGTIELISSPEQEHILRFTIPIVPGGTRSVMTLDTWIPFPKVPVQVWVKPPAGANKAPSFDVVYGLELVSTANQNRVWVLFGDNQQMGKLEPGLHYWMTTAPRETWSRQTLDLEQIFTDLHLDISPAERMTNWSYEFPVSMLNFRLLLAARNLTESSISADFGPVNVLSLRPDVDRLIRDRLAKPEELLIWRGDLNYQARNFNEAIDYYEKAIVENPEAVQAYYGMAKSKLWEGDVSGAFQAFDQASAFGVDQGAILREYAEAGWIQYNAGEYDEAVNYFRQALNWVNSHRDYFKSDANVAGAFNGLGWALLKSHKCDEAIPYLEAARIISLNNTPVSPDPQQGLEVCYGGN